MDTESALRARMAATLANTSGVAGSSPALGGHLGGAPHPHAHASSSSLEDHDALMPSLAASTIMDLKDALSGNNGE